MRGSIPKSVVLLFVCAVMSAAASAQNFVAEGFSYAVGASPIAGPLVQGSNGHLYGTASAGGSTSGCPGDLPGCGTVFEVAPTGKMSALYTFCSLPNCADGFLPEAGLILGTDGSLYGTTFGGGAAGVVNGYGYTGGTVFKISPSGKLTTLHSFCSQINAYGVCLDGAWPMGLIQASDGNIYGITEQGGGVAQGLNCYEPDGNEYGCGTIFKISPNGKLTTVYNFCPQLNSNQICPDGEQPQATLVQGSDGNLYGTTAYGGSNVCSVLGCGNIFKITPSGKLSTVYNFCQDQSCADGQAPGMLVAASNGNLYGMTSFGGLLGGGSIFEIVKSGKLTTLYSFCNETNGGPCPNGASPTSLMQAKDGNFYGTTLEGGANCPPSGSYGCGTVFRMTSAGAITILHSFCETNCNDGAYPRAALAQGTDGSFYGLASEWGSAKNGTIFRLSTAP